VDKPDNPGVIVPPPLIFLSCLVLGYFINRFYPLPFLDRPLSIIISAIFFAYAALTAGLAFYYMKKSGTNVNTGKPTNTIITKSVFSYSRNPIYLAMILLLVAFSLFLNILWIIILIPAFVLVMQKGVIEREEAYLENKFGSDYLTYKSRVRRWL
jgi:protein-S-isoprenylcysteine O-methyltransferase Ste14